MLERHAIALRECGVTELIIVTGYLRERIAEALPPVADKYELAVREISNPRFQEGSVLSLAASLPKLERSREPVLLMDADVLYPAAMLQRLIASPHATALLIDREYSTADDDPILVPVKNGQPIDFRKQWTGHADFVGESIGFFKIGVGDLPMLIAETLRRSTGADGRDSYDDVLRELVLAGRFGFEDVTELPWTEIDFPQDVVRAREEVLPAIARL